MKTLFFFTFLFLFLFNINSQTNPCDDPNLQYPSTCPCEGTDFCNSHFEDFVCTPSQVLIDCGVITNPDGCEMVNEAYIENTCFNSIERILSRTVAATYLSNNVWEDMYDGEQAPIDENGYCETIRFLVESEASLITRAAGLWGSDNQFTPCLHPGQAENGNPTNRQYLQSVRQMVCDINSAYDCAGLIRPFIQAAMLEHLDVDPGGNHLVEYMHILPCVIQEFANDYPNFPTQIYCQDTDGNGVVNNLDLPCEPRNDIRFDIEQMVFTDNNGNISSDIPDMTKLQTLMWFYQNSMLYMDSGINAFTLGQVSLMAILEKNNGYPNVQYLLGKIRGYAENLNIDILIEAEPRLPTDGEDAEYYSLDANGNKHFFFDYNKYPLWVSELTDTQYTDDHGCSNPTDEQNIFSSEGCAGFEEDALFDLCHLKHLQAFDQAGFSPDGNCYYDNFPMLIYFDYGHGCLFSDFNNDGNNDTPCDVNNINLEVIEDDNPTHPVGQAWGYDDANWFSRLPEECKIEWFRHVFCESSISDPFFQKLYLEIPAKLPNNLCCTGENNYYIADEPNFMQSVINLMEPDLSDWNLSYTNEFDPTCPQCGPSIIISQNPYIAIYKTRVKNPKVSFSVSPDCTSSYTWHIRKPDGTWLDFQKGPSGSFVPDQEGEYTVSLRRDNMGFEALDPNTYGSNTTEKKIFVKFCDFYAQCINDILKRYYKFNYSCKPNGSHNIKLNFENEPINGITLTANQGQILTTPIYNYQKSEIEFSYRSAKLPDSNNDIRDVMDINIIDSRYPYTARAIEVMDACKADEARITNVKEISTSKVEIYPNPTSGIINFKLEDSDDFIQKIEIFTLEGKKVVEFNDTKTLKSGSLNTQNLMNGIYLIKGLTNKSKFEEKIIISK